VKINIFSNIRLILKVFFFFNLTCFGWLLFRASSLRQAFQMLQSILNLHIISKVGVGDLLFYLWFLFIIKFVQYKKNDLNFILRAPTFVKIVFYYTSMFLLIFFGAVAGKQFIYFQF